MAAGKDGQYDLIKIMDKIRIIRNYNEQNGFDGTFSKGWWSNYSGSFGFSLYAVRQPYFPPIGCRVPQSADYQDIIDYLLKNCMNGAEIGRAFIATDEGVGVVGYRATRHDNNQNKVDYWTSDEDDKPKMVRIEIGKRTISIIDADECIGNHEVWRMCGWNLIKLQTRAHGFRYAPSAVNSVLNCCGHISMVCDTMR